MRKLFPLAVFALHFAACTAIMPSGAVTDVLMEARLNESQVEALIAAGGSGDILLAAFVVFLVIRFFPSTSGRVLFLKGRYPVATGRLPLSEIKICWSKPHLWPHI